MIDRGAHLGTSMRRALFACCALIATPALAADEPRPSLAEVMTGATALAALGSGYLFVSNAEGGWMCAINASANHFAALRDGDDVVDCHHVRVE